MKHLIILLLLIIAIDTQGQYYKAGYIYPSVKIKSLCTENKFIVPNYNDSDYFPKVHYDTNKVMILFCDTSRELIIDYGYVPRIIEGDSIWLWTSKKDTTLTSYNKNVYWAMGYEVIKTTMGKKLVDMYNLFAYKQWQDFEESTFIKYLDKNKKETPKNIIVWDSKNIK